MLKKNMVFIIIAVVGVVVYFGWKMSARNAYETAEYRVLEADNAFEIREYPELALATTDMTFGGQGDDGSFSRLFAYITGANDRKQKVAMTTPVFMEKDPTQSGRMGFVIPKSVKQQRIPEPTNGKVDIERREGGTFATIRFDGRMDDTSIAAAEERLRVWMQDNELEGRGDIEVAGYDPPWIPGPLRRNEILIRID